MIIKHAKKLTKEVVVLAFPLTFLFFKLSVVFPQIRTVVAEVCGETYSKNVVKWSRKMATDVINPTKKGKFVYGPFLLQNFNQQESFLIP